MHPIERPPRVHQIPRELKGALKGVSWFKDLRHTAATDYASAELFPPVAKHWLPILLPFETTAPQRYYCEAVTKAALEILCSALDASPGRVREVFSSLAYEIDSASSTYNMLATLAAKEAGPALDRELRFRHYVFPSYLQLLEGVWRPLMRLCYFASSPIAIEIPSIERMDYRRLSDAMQERHPALFNGCEPFLRNAIAHQRLEFSEDVAKVDLVTCMNYNERKKAFDVHDFEDEEILGLFNQLFDTCSGLLYAVFRFLPHAENQEHPLPLSSYLRRQVYAGAISDRYINLLGTTFNDRNGMGRNIEISYRDRCDLRVLHFGLYALKLAIILYPSESYFISIGRSKEQPYLWIITTRDKATDYYDGKLSFQDYLQSGDFQFLVPSRLLLRRPRFHAVIRNLPAMLKSLPTVVGKERRRQKGWTILSKVELLIPRHRRVELAVVLLREMTDSEIRRMILLIIRRQQRPFRNLAYALWNLVVASLGLKARYRSLTLSVRVCVWRKMKRRSFIIRLPEEGDDLCAAVAEWNPGGLGLWLAEQEHDERHGAVSIRFFPGSH